MRVETVQREILTFAELDDAAKEAAISKFYKDEMPDMDSVYSDFIGVSKILGIDIAEKNGKPCLYWSGFWSQGDGASFAGSWSYAKGCVAEIKKYAPTDKKLHEIAARLAKCSGRTFYQATAEITQSGRYSHEMTMQIDCGIHCGIESELLECFRDLARWFYSALESEYNYQTSIDAFSELCEANAYEFDAAGNLI